MGTAYQHINQKDLILRDLLAVDRTKLANERTLLAYLRTGFAFAAGAVTLLKIFPSDLTIIASYILLTIAILISVFGVYRYLQEERQLGSILQPKKNVDSRVKIKMLFAIISGK